MLRRIARVTRIALIAALATAPPADRLAAQATDAPPQAPDAPPQAPDAPPPGWIGIAFDDTDHPGGIVVRDVFRGGPADRAGLRPADTIVRIGDEPATPERLLRLASDLRPGRPIVLGLRRGDRIREVEVTAGARPLTIELGPPRELRGRIDSVRRELLRSVDSLRWSLEESLNEARRRMLDRERPRIPRPPSPHILGRDFVAGARLTALNPGLADYFAADEGVLVTEVLEESPAGEAGLRSGDVIVSAGGTAVHTVGALRASLASARSWPVQITVVRQGERMRIPLGR